MNEFIQVAQEPIMFRADNVGDGTYYNVVLADWPKREVVYVAIGGKRALTAGGFVPYHVLEEFNRDVTMWFNSENDVCFFDMMSGKTYYKHMSGHQVDWHAWQLMVALIFAWIYHVQDHKYSLVSNHAAMKVIGALHTEDRVKTREIFYGHILPIPF